MQTKRIQNAIVGLCLAWATTVPSVTAQSISVVQSDDGHVTVSNEFYRVVHNAKRGGSIERIVFTKTGKDVPVEMDDMLANGYRLVADTNATVKVEKERDGSTVVIRVDARYRNPNRPREECPSVTYRFTYHVSSPVVRIDAEIPSQAVEQEFSNLQQFAFNFGKEKTFTKLRRLIVGGSGAILPASFEFSPCEWRPNAGALYTDADNALAIISPVMGAARLDAEANHVVTRAFLAQWTGRRLTSGANLVIGPSADVEKHLAALTAPGGVTPVILRGRQLLAEAEKAASSAKKPTVIESEGAIALANKHTALLFAVDKTHVSLDAMSRDGHLLVRSSDEMRSMWQMTFKDSATGRLIPIDPTYAVAEHRIARPDGKTVALIVRWPKLEVGKSFVEATVTISLRQDDPLSRWKIQVRPLDDKVGLWEVAFPVVAGVAPDAQNRETDFLVFPGKSGTSMPNPTVAGLCEALYPGECGWQFMAYWQGNKGLYFGAHDSGPAVKTLRSLPTGDGALELTMIQPVPNQGLPGNGFDMPYEVAVGTFEGDWFDATQIYREWLVQQKWFPRKPLHATKDVPQWMKDVVVSTRRSGTPEMLDTSIELHEGSSFKEYHAGVLDELKWLGEPPTLLWWYHAWYERREANEAFAGTPDFAAPPGFADGLQRAKKHNLRVIAYTLACWWDYANPSWTNENAAAAVCILPDGKPNLYTHRRAGIMCPAAEPYQKKMQRVIQNLQGLGPVDGTYFDLGGTSGASFCYSTQHGHPVGSGAWNPAAKRQLMAGMRSAARKKNPEFVLVMEGNADCYLDAVDGYALFEENTPVRLALYADYRRPAGSKRTTWENSPLEAINPAKQFAWGTTIGRFVSSELISGPKTNEKAVAYYRRLVEHKTVARPWLNLGKMLRPVTLSKLQPASPSEVVSDTMLPHGTWQAPDGSIAFAFANARHSAGASFEWNCTPSTYGIPTNGKWALYALEPKGQPPAPQWTHLADITGAIQRGEKLGPGGTLIVVAKLKDGRAPK